MLDVISRVLEKQFRNVINKTTTRDKFIKALRKNIILDHI